MNKAVLISIQPKWCELIANGVKTIEVRKSRPKLETPFKCYIYCTMPKGENDLGLCLDKGIDGSRKKVGLVYKRNYEAANQMNMPILSGKVIGEFVCDAFITDKTFGHDALFNAAACMSDAEIAAYFVNKEMYGWHISNIVIYDKPKELSEFRKINRNCWYADLGLAKRDCPDCKNADCFLLRPPQSWFYVEVM